MIKFFIIGLGGFLGAVARFYVGKLLNPVFNHFPLGTIVVNIAGTFLLAWILYRVNFGQLLSGNEKDFWVIGVLGAFTTMSTFSYEAFRLFELKHYVFAITYLILTLAGCFIAIYLGKRIAG